MSVIINMALARTRTPHYTYNGKRRKAPMTPKEAWVKRGFSVVEGGVKNA